MLRSITLLLVIKGHLEWVCFLQAKMSRGCSFLLFWHHSYKVTLNIKLMAKTVFYPYMQCRVEWTHFHTELQNTL